MEYPKQRNGRRSAMVTLPNPHFLKTIFPIQDEQIKDFEPHADNFEMELKKFYSQGRRRSGRSTILARVMVETALETGQMIAIAGHEIDARVGSNAQHHLMGLCRDYIEKLRREGCDIGIIEMQRDKMKLYLDPYSFSLYNSLKIENNPTKIMRNPFPVQELEKRKQFLKRRLLLLL